MVTVLYRFVLSYSDCLQFSDGPLVFTEDKVWLSRECLCDIGGLQGVPQKLITVAVDQRVRQGEIPAGYLPVVEVCRKAGRFDLSERDHLVVRLYQAKNVSELKLLPASIKATFSSDEKWEHGYYEVAVRWDGGEWVRSYKCLRSKLSPGREGEIVLWHARWYPHLPADEVQALAARFTPPEGCDLNTANRQASRELYRLSRDLGWHKLTARERQKLGWNGGQWVDEATYARLQSGRERQWPHARPAPWTRNPGVGEATLVAAAGPEVTRGSTSWVEDSPEW